MNDTLLSAGLTTLAYVAIMVIVCAMMGLADERRVRRPERGAARHWWLCAAAMAAALVASVVCPMGYAPGYGP